MMVYAKIYSTLPEEACYIREAVFVQEQGFFDEFDNARTFTEMIQYLHPEFKVRPVKEITGEN